MALLVYILRPDVHANTYSLPAQYAGAVVTGSHCDAIPHAGMYDGTLGVLGGIAAIKGLQDAGFKPQKSIEVLFFTSEEPTRFGLGCIGRCVLHFYSVCQLPCLTVPVCHATSLVSSLQHHPIFAW